MEAEPLAPAEPEYWLSLATRSNPRALSANEAAARGKHLVDVEKASAYPTVGLQFYHDRRKTEGSLFGGGSDIRQYGGRVRLDVPIYAGGMVKSRVREAQNLVRKADAEADRTLRSVERETLQAMDAITSASARVTALRASLAAQEKAVSQLAAAYRAGVSSSVDYLDAERDLFRARTELLRARYDYALGTIRLRHAVGMLGIEDLAELELHMTPSSAAA
jgi:outer membrane protein